MIVRTALLLALGLSALAAKLKINCGGPELPAITWRADTGAYRSANSLGFPSTVDVAPTDPFGEVYKSHAFSFGGNLTYTIPVPPATYNVYLRFAETWSGATAGARQFSLSVNGVVQVPVLDVFAAGAGINKPVFIPVPNVDASSGSVIVTLGRIPGKNNPMISGIVIDGVNPAGIIDGTAGTPTVTPTVSASASASQSVGVSPSASPAAPPASGEVKINVGGPAIPAIGYDADAVEYIVGPTGVIYTSTAAVSVAPGESNAALYNTERFTFSQSLTYRIPVPSGTYTVTTMHSESFFTTAGARVFSVAINGVVVRANLDVFAAVGKDVALVLDFPNIAPDAGFITVAVNKGVENPLINAIKITAAAGGVTQVPTPSASTSVTPSVSTVPAAGTPAPTGAFFKMNVGGPAIPEIGYVADNLALISSGVGTTFAGSTPVVVPAGAVNAAVYNTERITFGAELVYNLPAPAGVYTVSLEFSEAFFAAAGERVFGVEVAGVIVRPALDIFAEVGKDTAFILNVPNVSPTAGVITVKLIKVTQNPLLNGIVLTAGATVVPPTPTATATPSTSVAVSASASPAVVAPPADGDILKMNVGAGAVAGYTAENVALISGATGTVVVNPNAVTVPAGATNAAVFQTERIVFGPSLTYVVPVPAGTYTVSTLHSESFVNAAGMRVFSIEINGVVVRANLDIFAAVGKNVALTLDFPNIAPVSGAITIKLLKGVENPTLNGIKITTANGVVVTPPPGTVSPTPSASASLIVQPTPTTSPSVDPSLCDVATGVTGRAPGSFSMNVGGPALSVFGAENMNYVEGMQGFKATSTTPVSINGVLMPVFFTYRFTFEPTLKYRIPVPSGSYTVTTYHAESFFSVAGSRVFNIVINGNAVATGVDVFARVGKDVALVQEFTAIGSVGGFIEIEFTKSVENPFVNAIRISGPGADTIAIAGREDGSCKAP